ncbi:hypothetical protein CALVIDRAFT_533569 [Calocera viscosa TUFC12733]|uniref:Uncharacterized protein n=1 Tax=Calocera viscosa (strain TUFC12733) TaxID=1330018 RepID=A0A167R566_CALVF|nr:hypothetical protein CALVIDRAFT_533569 [Calocera viscosa TUFC12733]
MDMTLRYAITMDMTPYSPVVNFMTLIRYTRREEGQRTETSNSRVASPSSCGSVITVAQVPRRQLPRI